MTADTTPAINIPTNIAGCGGNARKNMSRIVIEEIVSSDSIRYVKALTQEANPASIPPTNIAHTVRKAVKKIALEEFIAYESRTSILRPVSSTIVAGIIATASRLLLEAFCFENRARYGLFVVAPQRLHPSFSSQQRE